MPSSTSTTFHRSATLTAVLIVATLNHAVVFALLVTTWSRAIGEEQPAAGFLPLSVAGAAVTLVSYAGLWTGRRWAFWLLAVMTVVAAVTMVMVDAPTPILVLQAGLQLLLGAAVLRRWSSFT